MRVFGRADRDFKIALCGGLGLFASGAAMIVAVMWGGAAIAQPPSALTLAGAALLLAASGFFCAALIALERKAVVQFPFGEWPQAVVTLICIACAATGLHIYAYAAPVADDATLANKILGGVLILAAFPLLVAERAYAGERQAARADAPGLARLLRLPLCAFIASGAAILLRSAGFETAIWIERAVACLIVLAGIEIALRAAATFFIPFAPLAGRKSVADSFIAGSIGFAAPRIGHLNATLKTQFGIDLSRSRALNFLARSLPASIGALILGAWALTGLTATGLAERSIYERFGAPVAVLGPGLHLHLPWPFGAMRHVEFGAIHEIAIVSGAASDPTLQTPPAESPPPATADRLWDGAHPAEASYLLASQSSGRQGFQIANVDLRVVYRVGLSDDAALRYAYSVDDPEALLRAITGRTLARFFARNTLSDMLGLSQATFTEAFRADVQAELDRMQSGLESISVIVEAIHPPAGAAAAYHDVQAAEISAKSRVASEQGEAIRNLKAAERTALLNRNDAEAAAAETTGKATADGVAFGGDAAAYRIAGAPWLTERLFDRLAANAPKSELVIVDHRLKGASAPTLDLRAFAAPLAAPRSPGGEDPAMGADGRRPGDED